MGGVDWSNPSVAEGVGWVRAGDDVIYYQSPQRRPNGNLVITLKDFEL